MKKPCYILRIIVKWNDISTVSYTHLDVYKRQLFAPEVGHTNCKLYEQYKFDEVVKFRAVPEITHRKWKELNLMSPPVSYTHLMIMEINLDISTIMEIYDTMQFGKGVVSPLNYKERCV